MPAKVFTVRSNLFVLFSIVATTLNTVEELEKYKNNAKTHMEWVEIITIVFFTFERLIHLATTPNIKRFLKSGINFVDMVAIMLYFLQIIFEAFIDTEDVNTQEDLRAMTQVSKLSHVLKVSKLLQIFWILKLACHSTGMRAFGFTLHQCSQQALCSFFFIAMGIFTFSALLHSAEKETGLSHQQHPISLVVGCSQHLHCGLQGCGSYSHMASCSISSLFNNFSDYYSNTS